MNLEILTEKYFDTYQQLLPLNLNETFANLNNSQQTIDNSQFYFVCSAVYSSNIEGNTISIDTYFRHLESKHLKQTRDVKEIEDLIRAYQFAQNNKLTLAHLLKAHHILSKTFLIKSACGKLRTQSVAVYRERIIEYVAVEPEYVKTEIDKLFSDIKTLLKTQLTFHETFYYGSWIHLVFLKIHPFMDGNGRSARLLEKWFLAEKLGEKAWAIPSEQFYQERKNSYYKNVHLGGNYYVLHYDAAIPFLLMLPQCIDFYKQP